MVFFNRHSIFVNSVSFGMTLPPPPSEPRIAIIAPQAPLEESATTEASRRCSLTGILAGFKDGFGDSFLRFCDWYLRFGCPEHGPRAAPDRPDLSCLRVRTFVQLFAGLLLDRF